MTPMQIKRMRLNRASLPDVLWLHDTLVRISARFGTQVERCDDGTCWFDDLPGARWRRWPPPGSNAA
jgi:hypothetical protein